MNDAKYIGLDVHQATISAAVLDSDDKLVMESILETKAATVLQFVQGLRGSLHITFEEGTCAAWLHSLLQPHVTRVVVCDPRKNALLKSGNKNGRILSRAKPPSFTRQSARQAGRIGLSNPCHRFFAFSFLAPRLETRIC
jgi:hypothetical protein